VNYNLKLVQEAGLDPEKFPETWDELLDWHIKLTQRDAAGNVTGQPFLAVDLVGAGEGELVIVSQGSSARAAAGNNASPADAAIVGILDSLQSEGIVSFRKE